MSKGSDALEDAITQAKKIAGKKYKAARTDGKYVETQKAIVKFSNGVKEFHKLRKDMEKSLLEIQDANSQLTNILKQMDNIVTKETFGLDEDNADDSKKIDQMRQLISKGIDVYEKENDDQNKKLDELDKHLEDIAGYKSP